MELRSAVVGPRQTATAKGSGLHAKVSSVFLDQYIGCDLGSSKQAVQAVIDGKVFRNTLVVFVLGVNLPTRFHFHQRQLIRSVTIHFISRGEDKYSIRGVTPGHFEHVERAVGVHRKIGQRCFGRPGKRGLCCGMND